MATWKNKDKNMRESQVQFNQNENVTFNFKLLTFNDDKFQTTVVWTLQNEQ